MYLNWCSWWGLGRPARRSKKPRWYWKGFMSYEYGLLAQNVEIANLHVLQLDTTAGVLSRHVLQKDIKYVWAYCAPMSAV